MPTVIFPGPEGRLEGRYSPGKAPRSSLRPLQTNRLGQRFQCICGDRIGKAHFVRLA